jgi:hypothetical protein
MGGLVRTQHVHTYIRIYIHTYYTNTHIPVYAASQSVFLLCYSFFSFPLISFIFSQAAKEEELKGISATKAAETRMFLGFSLL